MVRVLIGVYCTSGWCATAGRQTLGDRSPLKAIRKPALKPANIITYAELQQNVQNTFHYTRWQHLLTSIKTPMATLNRFQIYSQGENTITNNVLLALANAYDLSPTYYQELIISLSDESSYTVGPIFNQQIGNRGDGIIDGHIRILPSTIVVETKISSLERKDKLVKYIKSFDKNQTNILFHLSTEVYSDHDVEDIRNQIQSEQPRAQFQSITYEDIVEVFSDLSGQHPYDTELKKLANEFEDYCVRMQLINQGKHVLRAMACGQSFKLNEKHQFYFDVADRGFSNFKYLGIYKQKTVRFIGIVENNIEADYIDGELDIKSSSSPVTDAQRERLIGSIEDIVQEGWENVAMGHRFFLLTDFVSTNFRKTSKGGIFRVRYFDLSNLLDDSALVSTSSVATSLSGMTWT